MENFPKLLTPARIGPVEIRNRIFTSSMCLYFSGKDGEVTDRMIAFFDSRAKAGMGAFIIPANPHGANKRARGSLADDSRIAQWKPLLDALHGRGAKAFCQIHPSGIQFGRKDFTESPFDLSTEEIKQLIESYAEGARRAQKAGFDGVEIHGAHGHEVALLLSELLNTRTDQYGGSLENCARTVTEMISRMKELCGKDFPVILRISGEERIPGGRELPASLKICQLVQDAGADAIHVSSGMPESEEWECPPSEVQQGHLAWMGRCLKEGLKIPVIVVGRIVDWEVGESMIEKGEADFIAVARTTLAEPRWVESVGKKDYPVRKCIGCNQGCRTRREQNKSMAACLQNPSLGREELLDIRPDAQKRNVAVIGGGVAGLEAANILSQRGHDVTIFEKEPRLGGTFYWAAKAPGKQSYMNVIEYYEKILPLQGVKFELNTTVDDVPPGQWDLIVLAVGGTAIRPPIRVTDARVCSALEFIDDASHDRWDGDSYVVIGDGIVGYEVADTILENGKKAILVGNDPREPVATLGVARWHFMKNRFDKTGIEVVRHSTVQSVDGEGLTIRGEDGTERRIDGRFRYILACGYKPASPEFIQKFQKKGIQTLLVGNAETSGDAMDAIHDAFNKTVNLTFE
ncbi:MAG: NAD(P)/FAD-dependent oxidoreductase [Synergistaceae bacterium]|jgi:2,4-dienoyl-CoA reductase-like NADH-dependent reductase (Old Yellow Enzyme family)/NADPH-dependent 2,4-dienoyl-CoA reductase/sulfur reductase-like enzyme|nr:NAD(P)/FAD-dependent oxidoreductase [Synergistaceae bacterium]